MAAEQHAQGPASRKLGPPILYLIAPRDNLEAFAEFPTLVRRSKWR